MGLTGVGDLIVTCSSVHSRNFQAGLEIGKTNDARAFMKNNKKLVKEFVLVELFMKMLRNIQILNYLL